MKLLSHGDAWACMMNWGRWKDLDSTLKQLYLSLGKFGDFGDLWTPSGIDDQLYLDNVLMAIGGDGNGSGPSSSYSGQPLARVVEQVEEVLRTGGGDGKTIIIAIVQQGNGAVEDVRRVEIRSLEDSILAEGERNDFPKEKALQLIFVGEVPDKVQTSTVITSKNGECLKLVLVDSETGETVDCAPESSAEVEIVVLEGESNITCENFETSTIKIGEKKKPHFAKRVCRNLKEGVVYLRDVKLGHDSVYAKIYKCRLGARIGRSLYAWTSLFEARDNREKYKEKHHPPKFSSKVWRLDRIGKGSAPCKRLNGKDIKTVSDFLFWFHVNAQELKQILHRGDGHWKVIVDHAKTCITDDDPRMHYDDDPRMYCHKSPNEPQTSVVYNVVGKMKGVIKESHFVPIDNLSAHEKDHAYELLVSVLEGSAFKERYNTPFNVEASLPYSSSHEVIASTSSSLQPLCQNIYQATKKRGSSSQTIYPNHVPYSMPSHSHVSEEMGELCNPTTLAERHHNMVVFKRVKFNPQVPRLFELCPDHEKNETPSLFDQVSCLVNICKDGEIHKSLQANRINTVEEFLIRLLINKEEIRQMVSLEREEWEATVSNAARASMTGNRTYCYMSLNLRKGVVFNLLGDVLGLLSFDKHFCPANMLSEHDKGEARKLLASALKNWTDVEPYNELDHLHYQLSFSPGSNFVEHPVEPYNELDHPHYQLSSSPGSNFVEHQNEPFDGAVPEFCDGFLSTSPNKTSRSFVFGIFSQEFMMRLMQIAITTVKQKFERDVFRTVTTAGASGYEMGESSSRRSRANMVEENGAQDPGTSFSGAHEPMETMFDAASSLPDQPRQSSPDFENIEAWVHYYN